MLADARPLQPEFVPGDVRHRDGEIDALTSTLAPILDGGHAEPALLYGPSGTGKTCIARYAIDQLHKEVVDLHIQPVLEHNLADVHRTWELGELVRQFVPAKDITEKKL